MGIVLFLIQKVGDQFKINRFSLANVHQIWVKDHLDQGKEDPLSVDKVVVLVSIILRLAESGIKLDGLDMGGEVIRIIRSHRVFLDETPISKISREQMKIDGWFSEMGFEDENINLENISNQKLLELGRILIP